MRERPSYCGAPPGPGAAVNANHSHSEIPGRSASIGHDGAAAVSSRSDRGMELSRCSSSLAAGGDTTAGIFETARLCMRPKASTDCRETRWSGCALVRPGCVALDVSVGPQALHAHHAWQVMVVPGGIEIQDAFGSAINMECVVIPPNQPHRVGPATRAWMVYIDPTHASVRHRDQREPHAAAWEADALLNDVLGGARRGAFDLARLLTQLQGVAPPCGQTAPSSAQAVLEAMRIVRAHGDLVPALRDVAGEVGTSPRALSKGFVVHAGLPFRRYVRWQRVVAALDQAAAGASLTAAAHAAGFHDSAHMHHAFQQFFGVAPSRAMLDIRWPASPVGWWAPDGADSV